MKNVPIIEKREYVLLKRYLRLSNYHFDAHQSLVARKLIHVLHRAKVVDEEEMPSDVIRLNTTVIVSQFGGDIKRFQIVIPDTETDDSTRVSVVSYLGVSLFGSRIGDKVVVKSSNTENDFVIKELFQPSTRVAVKQ